MILRISGEISASYVQTLCLMLFPGVSFPEGEAEEAGSLCAEVELTPVRTGRDVTGCRASVRLRCGDRRVETTHTVPYDSAASPERAAKIAVGHCFFSAGEALFSYRPAWGILTGVRPAKLASEYLEKGWSPEEIRALLRREMLMSEEKAALVTDVALFERPFAESTPPDTCSLYVSIPFCPTRCAYCSFVSCTTPRLLSLIPDYLEKLLSEIRETASVLAENGLRLETVYVGGGTPSTLDADALKRLTSGIRDSFPDARLSEFTVECGRPDTITEEKLRALKETGVNRISVNPQTLNDEVLARIGRKHTTEMFFRAFSLARDCGIPMINTDLIAGLPGESFKSFSRSVDQILELRPENVTVHTFCVKRSSQWRRDGADVYSREGETASKSVSYSHSQAREAGYSPYYLYRQKNTVGNLENVGFCLPGTEGRYNILMMEELHSVFAVGAGGVTKLVSPDRKRIERIFSPKYPYEYLEKDARTTVSPGSRETVRQFFAEETGREEESDRETES